MGASRDALARSLRGYIPWSSGGDRVEGPGRENSLPPLAPPWRTPSVTCAEQASPVGHADHSELVTVRQRWVVRVEVRD